MNKIRKEAQNKPNSDELIKTESINSLKNIDVTSRKFRSLSNSQPKESVDKQKSKTMVVPYFNSSP